MADSGGKGSDDWVVETFDNDEEALDAVDTGTVVGTKRCFMLFIFNPFVSSWDPHLLIDEKLSVLCYLSVIHMFPVHF